MHQFYEKLVTTSSESSLPLYVKEKRRDYKWVTERHLQALWWEQHYFSELYTSEGKRVEVLSPGQWNALSGPDFRKAHLRIDQEELKGDVEVHLYDNGWVNHQHHTNPDYNHTILHVSFWSNPSVNSIKTCAGKEIARLYVDHQLTIPIEKISQRIDLDLYPYKPHLGTGKCYNAIFKKFSRDHLQHFFASAAFWRFFKKGEAIIALGNSLGDAFKAAVARMLGCPSNSSVFLSLYQWLAYEHYHKDIISIQALALGSCGYFGERYHKEWGISSYYQKLYQQWNINALNAPKFKFFSQRTRPLHHPVRRLATLSHLILDESYEQVLNQIEKLWLHRQDLCKRGLDWRKLWIDIQALLPTYIDAYWNTHYFFENTVQEYLTLIGDSIKKEIMMNVVIPILYYKLAIDSKPTDNLWKLIESINCAESGHSRYLKNRFLGDQLTGDVFKRMYVAQGAFQVYHDFCQQFETSCIGCPFVERVQERMTKHPFLF